MTRYAPQPQPWHKTVPGACSCDPAYKGRGIIDNHCTYHSLIEAIGALRDSGWIVEYPQPGGVAELMRAETGYGVRTLTLTVESGDTDFPKPGSKIKLVFLSDEEEE